MSALKYLQRLQQMDRLIRRCATGRPDTFAEKVGLSRSTLMEYLRELREIGAPIEYCKRRESYYYREAKQLFIGYTDYQLAKHQEQQLRGGAPTLSAEMPGAAWDYPGRRTDLLPWSTRPTGSF